MFRNTAKIILGLSLATVPAFSFAQNVVLSKVQHSRENSGRILYRVPSGNPQSEFLGEVDVLKAGGRPADLFAEFYKKAKQIGANSFSLNSDPLQNIGNDFKVSLYFTPEKSIPSEENTIYILSSADTPKKISVNGKLVEVLPSTYLRITLQPGSEVTVSTRKLLGSAVKFTFAEHQPVQYFALTALRFSENPDGTPGIRLKSGDITGLERSYAEFLMIGRAGKDF